MKYTAHEHLRAMTALAPQDVVDAAVTSPGVAKEDAREALLAVEVAGAGVTFTTVIEHSDDDVTYEPFKGHITKNENGSGVEGCNVGRLDLEGAKSFIRVIVTVAGTAVVSATWIFSANKHLPVSQSNPLMFNIQ